MYTLVDCIFYIIVYTGWLYILYCYIHWLIVYSISMYIGWLYFLYRCTDWLIDWLIDWIVSYAVSAISQSFNGGVVKNGWFCPAWKCFRRMDIMPAKSWKFQAFVRRFEWYVWPLRRSLREGGYRPTPAYFLSVGWTSMVIVQWPWLSGSISDCPADVYYFCHTSIINQCIPVRHRSFIV